MSAVLAGPGGMAAAPIDPGEQEAPAPAGAQPASRPSTVAGWKAQVSWFAAAMTVLVVLVAGGSAAAMWQVLSDVARSEQRLEERSSAAVAARLAVLDVDRLLVQTIAAEDPSAVRAAAVASIAAASRLEDAITALLLVLPGSADALEMRRLAEAVKGPRVNVIVLARKGERAAALQAQAAIAEPLRKIDELSGSVLEAQARERLGAAAERETAFARLVSGLSISAGLSIVVGFVFYRRLMQRFNRVDHVEKLLEEVAHSAAALDMDGRRLDGLNGEVQQANGKLRTLLDGFQSSCLSMTGEAGKSLNALGDLTQTCEESADTSRRHAQEAGVLAEQIRSTTRRMHQLLESADALGQRRTEIAQFADQIAAISSTTRLLSLNAAVEAAHAGDAGRGFGVIATSVRQLSEDTQKAAVEIRRASEGITLQLAATAEAVQQTSVLMDDCASRIAALDTSARANQALVGSMSSDVHGFRATMQRQVDRIQAMDRESQALADTLQHGQGHAQLLDATARALARTSTALHHRLSTLQE